MISSTAQLIALYRAAKARLASAKATELELRIATCAALFENPKLGTNWNDAKTIKMICGENYTLANDHNLIMTTMEQIASLRPDLQVSDLLDWKPSLNKSSYIALPDDAKALFNEILTIKPALATLEFPDEKATK